MPYIHNESGCGQYNISSNALEELIKSHRSVYMSYYFKIYQQVMLLQPSKKLEQVVQKYCSASLVNKH